MGACLFPGLAKISSSAIILTSAAASSSTVGTSHFDQEGLIAVEGEGEGGEEGGEEGGRRKRQVKIIIVRRAQVFCECALLGGSIR